MKHASLLVALVSLLSLSVQPVLAGGCYVDPVYTYNWSGKIKSAVFLRDNACSSGTSILTTLSANASVSIIGATDGWYYVEVNGARGWIGNQFVNVTSQDSSGNTWDSYEAYMQANPAKKPSTTPAPTPTPTTSTATDATLNARLRGYILLDVQQHGEAWYLNPTDNRRYYLRDGAAAYQMMRSFGLGVSEKDYSRIETGDLTLKTKLKGRIILRSQAHGEAYYIHPKTLAVHYLQDGPAAYTVMRYNSLGITSTDLTKLQVNEVPIK